MTRKSSTIGFYIYNLAEEKCCYLLKNLKGYLATNDPVHVHQIRVTIRRLIILLGFYRKELPKKSYTIAKRRLRNSLKMFSGIRDLDNLIDYLKTIKRTKQVHDEDALVRLLKALKAKRTAPRRDIAYYSSLREIQKTVRSVQAMFKQAALRDDRPLSVIPHLAIKCLDERFGDFARCGKLRYKKKQNRKLHTLRLSAKDLRYTLEIFEGYYKKDLKGSIALLRSFQDTLGRVNDRAVWIDMLSGIYKSSHTKATIREEYLYIKKQMDRERQKAYARYKSLIAKLKKQELRRSLRKVFKNAEYRDKE
jgi:CHAD domain-containing protein